MPKITVLMPVYNAVKFVGLAINSILRQTFGDFEFLIIDDASSDGTDEVIRRFRDPRIRCVNNESNMGVAVTLNKGIELARGKFVARMDADDISGPKRLERQVSFMEHNQSVGVVGSWIRFSGKYSRQKGRRLFGTSSVKASLCFENPFYHPSVMIRKSVIDQHQFRYRAYYGRSEDFDLWSRLSEVAELNNIPEVLLRYHVHESSITSVNRFDMDDQSLDILQRELRKCRIDISGEDLKFHRNVGQGKRMTCYEDINRAESWLNMIIQSNIQVGYHTADGMEAAASFAWYKLCANSCNLGLWIWRKYLSSQLSSAYVPSKDERNRMLASIVWNSVARIGKIGGDEHRV